MKKEDFKALIIAFLLILLESGSYFLCKLSPIPRTLLTSSFDDKLPFVPFFVCFYFLWYLFLLIIPFVLYKHEKKYLVRYASIDIICVIIASLIFIFFPTLIIRNVDVNNYKTIFIYPVKFIYFTDTPDLCCLPSMHCAMSFIFMYTALKIKEMKWYYKALIIFASFGIIASTLLIKQHVIWDVYAAIAVVVLSILLDRYTKVGEYFRNKVEELDKYIDKKVSKTKLGSKLK